MSQQSGDRSEDGDARRAALQFWVDSEGTPVTATLVDGTTVKATYVSATSDLSMIAVSDLETPIGVYPKAVLRANDLSHLQFHVKK